MRPTVLVAALLATVCFLLPAKVHADAFEGYTNLVLENIAKAEGVRKLKQLTPEMIVEHARVLPGITAALVIVHTHEGRWAKLLVQPARQKLGDDVSLPILLVERYVTFREAEERTIHVQGKNLSLFDGFRFNLDLGQVVPANVPADLQFHAGADKDYVEVLGKAEMYLVTRHLSETEPAKGKKLVVGDVMMPEYFAGVFQVDDDGKRSGKLHLSVRDDNSVAGYYYSDKDGRKYDVAGKVGQDHHSIEFKITYPRTIQFFHGWLFSSDAGTITGFSRIEDRTRGFYAKRIR